MADKLTENAIGLLERRLRDAVARLNPSIPPDAREQAVKEVLRLAVETGSASDLVTSNETGRHRNQIKAGGVIGR